MKKEIKTCLAICALGLLTFVWIGIGVKLFGFVAFTIMGFVILFTAIILVTYFDHKEGGINW